MAALFLIAWGAGVGSMGTMAISEHNAKQRQCREEDNARYENKITNIRCEMQRDLKAKDGQHQTALEKIRSDMRRDLKAKDEQHQTAFNRLEKKMTQVLDENAKYKNTIDGLEKKMTWMLDEMGTMRKENQGLRMTVRKKDFEIYAMRMLCDIRDRRVSTQMTRNQISELETLIRNFLKWLQSNSDATEEECQERFGELKMNHAAIDASPTFSEKSSLPPSGVTTFEPDFGYY